MNHLSFIIVALLFDIQHLMSSRQSMRSCIESQDFKEDSAENHRHKNEKRFIFPYDITKCKHTN